MIGSMRIVRFRAARITLARYTHALPEGVEPARDTLARYLAEAEEAASQDARG
jgi:hypothetical protein